MSKRANYFQVHKNKRGKRIPERLPNKFESELNILLAKNGIKCV